ncbi:MAG: RNA methyltransferase TrmH family, partial [Halothiobacillaceae bacterium]
MPSHKPNRTKPTGNNRRAKPPKPTRREIKYYGTAACEALWRKRPQDLIRVYIEESLVGRFSALLKWTAEQRKAYHIVAADDLERLTESIHHQGICILALEPEVMSFATLLKKLEQPSQHQLLLYLDGVENPHNLGALVRSCAHFGVRYVLGAVGRLPALSPSACRVAEGGAEYLNLIHLDQPPSQLQQLRDLGFAVVATRAQPGKSLYATALPRCMVLILGAEMEGVSSALLRSADQVIAIPGSGEVESLNVSVAGAIVMSE